MNFSQRVFYCYPAVLVCSLWLGLSGFVNLSDVEKAILNKDFAAAETAAESYIEQNLSGPEAATAKYYLGLAQLGLAKYSEARTSFAQVMEVNPSSDLYDRAWLGIIDTLGLQEDFSEALAQAERFLAERPSSEFLSVIYLKLGRANLKLSQWAKARKYLKQLVRKFPGSFEAHTGKQLLKEKRFFAIQVGSFLDKARAIALMEELKGKGEYAYILQTQDHEGRDFYRVRVGQFKDLRAANRMRQRLIEQGYPTYIYP